MSETKTLQNCLNCDRSEVEIPLVTLRHVGEQAWICSQCLPTLIHHPERLADKLVSPVTVPGREPATAEDAE